MFNRNTRKISPLQKVPFIQRVCLFAAKRHVDPMFLSQVSPAFSETLQSTDYGTTSTIYHNLLQYELGIAKKRFAIEQAVAAKSTPPGAAAAQIGSADDNDGEPKRPVPPFVRTEPLPTDYFLFHLCASPDHKEKFMWLIEALINTKDLWLDYQNPNNGKMTPLVAACICGNERSVELLLHNGANPNVGRRGENVVQNGSYPVLLAALKGKTRMLKALLEAGANISPVNAEFNPVFSCIKSKSSSCVKLLVEKGNCDLAKIRTVGNQSVLDLSIASSYFDGVLFILKKVNDDDVALEQKLLITSGTKYNFDDFGLPRLLGHKNASRAAHYAASSNPLIEALKCGNDKIFKMLLRYCKLDVERQNKLMPSDQQPKLTLAEAYTNVVWNLLPDSSCGSQLCGTLLVHHVTAIAQKYGTDNNKLSETDMKDLESFVAEIEVDPFAPVSIPRIVFDEVKRSHPVVTAAALNATTTFHFLFVPTSPTTLSPVSADLVSVLVSAQSSSKSKMKSLMSEGQAIFAKASPVKGSAASAAFSPTKPRSVIDVLLSDALNGGKNEKKKAVGKSYGKVEAEVLMVFHTKLDKTVAEVLKANPALKKLADEIVIEAASSADKKSTLHLLKSIVSEK